MCVIAVTHRRYTYLSVLQRQTQIRIDEGNCRTTQQSICSLEEAPKYCNMKPQQQSYIYRCQETLTSSALLYVCVCPRAIGSNLSFMTNYIQRCYKSWQKNSIPTPINLRIIGYIHTFICIYILWNMLLNVNEYSRIKDKLLDSIVSFYPIFRIDQ